MISSGERVPDFFYRRADLFRNINIEGTFQQRIEDLRARRVEVTAGKPFVVISGFGPAGGIRAIQSISNGNPTQVIEKRSEDAAGRNNTVALKPVTITMLKYCGIYQYLIENNLIYPPNSSGYICVRLGDLERAIRAVLTALSPDSIVQFNSVVSQIDTQGQKINVEITSREGQRRILNNVDILVNTEGSHSTTNNLLNITRNPVLPNIPVIAAFFKDRRPSITSVGSFFRYIGNSLVTVATTIYYHTQFIFRYAFSSNFRKQIVGSLVLKTPAQTYLGCGFSEEINRQLSSLKEAINQKKNHLHTLQSPAERAACEKEMQIAEQQYEAFAKQWINLSLCKANFMALYLLLSRSNRYMYMATHQNIESFDLIKIGADHANEYYKKYNNSTVLIAGDAAATVDPTTGLGCNTAIQTSTAFLDYIWDHDAGKSQNVRNVQYGSDIKLKVLDIHGQSIQFRRMYRPDALIV